MAKIAIANLQPAGSAFFQNSESFLHELTEQEVTDVLGGGKVRILWSAICVEW